MPVRKIVAKMMAEIISVVAHADRFRLIEELAGGEKDVDEIVRILKLPQPTVSQHLSALRLQRLVIARREGRHVFYSLRRKWIAKWLLDGLKLLEEDNSLSEDILSAARSARKLWTDRETHDSKGRS